MSAKEAREMFEAVEFIEQTGVPEPVETRLGEFSDELEAVDAAREARKTFMETETDDYGWWVVRKSGARLAQFIADSRSDREFVLDLTSGQLVEV